MRGAAVALALCLAVTVPLAAGRERFVASGASRVRADPASIVVATGLPPVEWMVYSPALHRLVAVYRTPQAATDGLALVDVQARRVITRLEPPAALGVPRAAIAQSTLAVAPPLVLDEPRGRLHVVGRTLYDVDLRSGRVVYYADLGRYAAQGDTVASFGSDPTTGVVAATLQGRGSAPPLLALFAPDGHLTSTDRLGGGAVACVDGRHRRVILYDQRTRLLSAREERRGTPVWSLRLADQPVALACDQRTGQAILVRTHGAALVDTLTHTVAPPFSGGGPGSAVPPQQPYTGHLSVDSAHGDGLLIWQTPDPKNGQEAAYDVLNPGRRLRANVLTAGQDVLSVDTARNLTFGLDRVTGQLFAVDLGTAAATVTGSVTREALSALQQASQVVGDDQAVYAVRRDVQIDPVTGRRTTPAIILAYPVVSCGCC